MTELSRLFVATLTRTGDDDPGTNATVNLVISEGGVDRLNQNLTADRGGGQANLDVIDVEGRRIDTERLSDGSIRIGVLGDDQWRAELVLVWGTGLPEGTVGNPIVYPLAIATDMTVLLSTNDPGAVQSVPLRRVARGSADVAVERLLLIVRTGAQDEGASFGEGSIGSPAGQGESATDDEITLTVAANGRIVVQQTIGDTPQEDLEGSQANIYRVPVPVSFTRDELASGDVQLGINGSDAWLPTSVFLFGLDTESGRPAAIVPLVHMSPWDQGALSTDTSEGSPSVNLRLVEIPNPGIVLRVVRALRQLVARR